MTDAERDDLYARLLMTEIERDAALQQLHELNERQMWLERRIDQMRKALD